MRHIGFGALGAIAVLAAFAQPAFADRNYEGQITGLTNPWGVTVDPGDNVWISQPESGGGLIFEYSAFPTNNKLFEENGEGEYGPTYIRSQAIDGANGDLYVADSGPEVVDVFNPKAASGSRFVEKWSIGGGYVNLAVDNSGGPSNGTVYVAKAYGGGVVAFEPNHTPKEFSATGLGYVSGNAITGTPKHGAFGRPWGAAVDGEGNIYVVDEVQRAVYEFHSSGEFVQEFTGAGSPQGEFEGELTGVAVDPTSGDVLIVDNGNHTVFEFGASGEYLTQLTGKGSGEEFGTLHGGVAVDSNGNAYIADGTEGAVDIFGPNALLPKITYGAATNQTQTGGTLNASVDLNGGPEVTACTLQYGTSSSYGSSASCSPPVPYASSPTAVSATLSGLTTEATYHYRFVVETANGIKKGADQTFLPHAVAGLTTQPATAVERNTAILNAIFNGNGEDTHYYFEWGTSTAYGHTTAAPPGEDAGSPVAPQELHSSLSGLTVETTYHYRVVASNNAGTSYGLDQSFKTLPAVEELKTEPASEITASTATLNASYDGIGEDVHYYFEWGPTSAYGNTTPAEPGADDGAQTGHQVLSLPLGALGINSPIHYRVVASDAAGITRGADRLFFTLGRYEFSTYYGSAGTGDGQFNHPQDLGVNEATGDIYVADTGNHRIVRLDAAGNFVSAWGWGVADGNAAAEVCTSSCQAGLAGVGAGQFTTPRYVEVDNSGGSSEGDVYVGDTADGLIQKFGPSGNLITSWGTDGALDLSGNGSIEGITVDASGDLFEVGSEPPYYWTEYGQDGLFQGETATEAYFGLGVPGGGGIEIDSAGGWYEAQSGEIPEFGVRYRNPAGVIYSGHAVPTPGTAGLVVDRTVNDLYVDTGGSIEQFSGAVPLGCASSEGGGLAGTGCPSTDTFGVGELSSAKGLAFDSATKVVYAANTGANDLALFHPLPIAAVTTGPVTNRGPETGTMTGEVDPNGPGTITSCYFQYGTGLDYGLGTIPCSPGAPLTAHTDVTADLSNLSPFTTYHYRLVAIREDGKGFPSYGVDRTYTPSPTLTPSIEESSISNPEPTAVTFHAVINPNLSRTVYRFQYGVSTGYGFQTPTSESIGEDNTDHAVGGVAEELKPATTYHYRVVAINFNGVTRGPDQTFDTPDAPVIAAESATHAGQTTVTLGGVVHPSFRATTYRFEYGHTSSYTSNTGESGPIGSDNAPYPVSASIGGLRPGATYHYRLVATNEIGASDGADQTFTTALAPTVTPPPPGCKPGYVLRNGKCVKRKKKHHRPRRHKREHHGRSHK